MNKFYAEVGSSFVSDKSLQNGQWTYENIQWLLIDIKYGNHGNIVQM